MNTNFYKKSGIIIMNIARDFFAMKVGDRISTIFEYTEKFSVSRGIVQNALARLEAEGCIAIEKKGVKGTFLTEIDYKKLYPYTNWGSVTGTMPVPLNPFLSSLTTAVCEQMGRAPFPFSFAYVTGSEKRMEAMKNMMYDFMIVSQSSAQKYLDEYDFLSVCAVLDTCIYSPEYVIYFINPEKTEIEDGMRVGIDPTCLDQAKLTKILCQGKRVSFVEFPYIAIEDLTRERKVDCVVYRILDWCNDDARLGIVRLGDVPGFSEKETKTPVILTNKENYGIDRLLQQYMNPEEMSQIQTEVLFGKRAVKFY